MSDSRQYCLNLMLVSVNRTVTFVVNKPVLNGVTKDDVVLPRLTVKSSAFDLSSCFPLICLHSTMSIFVQSVYELMCRRFRVFSVRDELF